MFSLIPNMVAGIPGKSPDLRKRHTNCIKAWLPQSFLKASACPTAALELSCTLGTPSPHCTAASLQMSTVTQSQANQDRDVIDKG